MSDADGWNHSRQRSDVPLADTDSADNAEVVPSSELVSASERARERERRGDGSAHHQKACPAAAQKEERLGVEECMCAGVYAICMRAALFARSYINSSAAPQQTSNADSRQRRDMFHRLSETDCTDNIEVVPSCKHV